MATGTYFTHPIRMGLRWFGLLALVLVVSSCGSTLVHEDVAPRTPDHVATRVGLYNVNHGACDVPGQFDTSVLSADSLARPVGGEVIAGFNNILIRGADPFPCNRQRSQEYTGALHFNFDDLRGTVIDHATLRLTRRNTSLAWNPSTRMCLVAVSRATEDWTPGYVSGPGGTSIAAVPFTRVSPSNRIEGGIAFDNGVTSISFDITNMAQRWANGQPNLGLIIHQEGETGDYVGANDMSCTSVFTAQLVLSVRRFVHAGP